MPENEQDNKPEEKDGDVPEKEEAPEGGSENQDPPKEGKEGGDLESELKAAKEELEKANKRIETLDKQNQNVGKVKEKADKEKQTLQEQIDDLKGQIAERDKKATTEYFDLFVSRFVKSDEDKEKVLKEYGLLNMPEGSREEVNARTEKALRLAGFEIEGDVSALNMPSSGSRDGKAAKSDKDKAREKELDNALFPHLAKIKQDK